MKSKYITVLLFALVIVQILDGDFKNPSALDFIKFVLLVIALVLNFYKQRRS